MVSEEEAQLVVVDRQLIHMEAKFAEINHALAELQRYRDEKEARRTAQIIALGEEMGKMQNKGNTKSSSKSGKRKKQKGKEERQGTDTPKEQNQKQKMKKKKESASV